MRTVPILALLLVFASLAPPLAAAQGGDGQGVASLPAPVVSAYTQAGTQVEATVESVRESVGASDPAVRQAERALERATGAFQAGDPGATLEALGQSLAYATWAEAEDEADGSQTPDQAVRARAEAERTETRQAYDAIFHAMAALAAEGLDPSQADHALLAAELAARGQLRLAGFSQGVEAWNTGGRSSPGPFTAAMGARVHAWIADELMVAARDTRGTPTGDVVGNSTLRQAVGALTVLVGTGNQSQASKVLPLLQADIEGRAWIASLGAGLTWGHEVPSLVVTGRPDGQGAAELEPGELVARLGQDLEDLDLADDAKEAGGLGVHTGHALAEAQAALEQAQEALATNDTGAALGQGLRGLGALTAAHLGVAMLRGLAGLGATEGVLHLPAGPTGTFEMAARDPGDVVRIGGVPAPWIWGAAGLAGVLLIGLAVWGLRRRRNP